MNREEGSSGRGTTRPGLVKPAYLRKREERRRKKEKKGKEVRTCSFCSEFRPREKPRRLSTHNRGRACFSCARRKWREEFGLRNSI